MKFWSVVALVFSIGVLVEGKSEEEDGLLQVKLHDHGSQEPIDPAIQVALELIPSEYKAKLDVCMATGGTFGHCVVQSLTELLMSKAKAALTEYEDGKYLVDGVSEEQFGFALVALKAKLRASEEFMGVMTLLGQIDELKPYLEIVQQKLMSDDDTCCKLVAGYVFGYLASEGMDKLTLEAFGDFIEPHLTEIAIKIDNYIYSETAKELIPGLTACMATGGTFGHCVVQSLTGLLLSKVGTALAEYEDGKYLDGVSKEQFVLVLKSLKATLRTSEELMGMMALLGLIDELKPYLEIVQEKLMSDDDTCCELVAGYVFDYLAAVGMDKLSLKAFGDFIEPHLPEIAIKIDTYIEG